jgi:hypothetical protein
VNKEQAERLAEEIMRRAPGGSLKAEIIYDDRIPGWCVRIRGAFNAVLRTEGEVRAYIRGFETNGANYRKKREVMRRQRMQEELS